MKHPRPHVTGHCLGNPDSITGSNDRAYQPELCKDVATQDALGVS